MNQQFIKKIFRQVIIPFTLGAFYLKLSGYKPRGDIQINIIFNLYSLFLFFLLITLILNNIFRPEFLNKLVSNRNIIIGALLLLFLNMLITPDNAKSYKIHDTGYLFILFGIYYLINYDNPHILNNMGIMISTTTLLNITN